MKSALVMTAILALIGIPTLQVHAAGNPDTGPGCGLGKLAWSDFKRQKDIAPQVLMATTNGTFGSQTFGISFGTSGCTNDGKVWAEQKTEIFVAATFENIAEDMARGQGEHLASLATMLGVPVEHQKEFFALAQNRYRSSIEAGDASPVAVIKVLQDAMREPSMLARLQERP